MGFFDWLFGEHERKFIPKQNSNDFNENRNFSFINYQIENLLRIYYESAEIVQTSKNIETVTSRFDVITDTIEKIMELKENPQVQQNQNFQKFLRDFQNFDAEEIYKVAVERFIENQIAEILKLKTERGKKNRVEKIFAIVDRLDELTNDSKDRVKSFLLERLNLKEL